MKSKKNKLKIFYDGACHLCGREVAHYEKLDRDHQLELIDISDREFDAKKWNLDPKVVNKYFHVITSDGKVLTGIEAFVEIWKLLPKYNWLARLADNFLVGFIMRSSYKVFAEIRPYLPKKKNTCGESFYCSR